MNTGKVDVLLRMQKGIEGKDKVDEVMKPK